MKRYTVLIALIVAALSLARRLLPGCQARMMEYMMEHRMPRMMDHCFGRMDLERRRFMLGHCRRMLDDMEAKYVPAPPRSAPHGG